VPTFSRNPGWVHSALLSGLSAAAFSVSTGLGEIWQLTWLAPVPILLLACRSSWGRAALWALAAWFVGSLRMFQYLAQVMPVAVVILILLLASGLFALTVLASRTAVLRLRPWMGALGFPLASTASEFLVSRVSPHGTANSLAYSQVDFLPVLQLASLCGIWGITFLLTYVPSAIATAWHRRAPSVLAPAAVLVGAAITFGMVRLSAPQGATMRVGLAATDQGDPGVFETTDREAALGFAAGYAQRVARLASLGADVVVLPEKFVGVAPAYHAELVGLLDNPERRRDTVVIAGINRLGKPAPRNVAVVLGGDDGKTLEYEKRHLLPGPETGYSIGQSPGLFKVGGRQWGVAICKDMDFPGWSRLYGLEGVRFLAVPAWDFVRDARLHSRMAVVRGVENGFAVARAARQGLLTLSDGYGRILAEGASWGATGAYVLAGLPEGPGATPYLKLGDWFGWMSVCLFAVLLVSARHGRDGGAGAAATGGDARLDT
jgi:apolipoprotein N-acyltransferase